MGLNGKGACTAGVSDTITLPIGYLLATAGYTISIAHLGSLSVMSGSWWPQTASYTLCLQA